MLLLSDIFSQAQYIPRAALLLALIMLVCAYFRGEDEGRFRFRGLSKHWRFWLFLFYLCFMLMSTLFARSIMNPYKNRPRQLNFLSNGQPDYGNILLFIPYTFLFLMAFRQKKPWRDSLILSFATTCLIEISQLLFWLGYFHVADIVYNVAGGIIGCALWRLAAFVLDSRGRKRGAETRFHAKKGE